VERFDKDPTDSLESAALFHSQRRNRLARVSLIQGPFGSNNNFEVVACRFGAGLIHFFRDQDTPGNPWVRTVVFGQDAGYGSVSMALSGRTLFAVAAANANGQESLRQFSRGADVTWSAGVEILPDAFSGSPGILRQPAITRSSDGLDLLVPLARTDRGPHVTYLKARTDEPFPHVWRNGAAFGDPPIIAASIIQSTFGNLETVAFHDGSYNHYVLQRGIQVPDDAPLTPAVLDHWVDTGTIQGLRGLGSPSLVQGHRGANNFELVVPAIPAGIQHFFRDHSDGNRWKPGALFATEIGVVDSVSMIESTFGNLEVVASSISRLFHFVNDSSGVWSQTAMIGDLN
jgi:hypothetical protein